MVEEGGRHQEGLEAEASKAEEEEAFRDGVEEEEGGVFNSFSSLK